MPTERVIVTVTPLSYPQSVLLEARTLTAEVMEGIRVGKSTRQYRGLEWQEAKTWIAAEPETFLAAQAALASGQKFPFGPVDLDVPSDVTADSVIAHSE